MKGSEFLKTVSIIMIVYAAIAAVITVSGDLLAMAITVIAVLGNVTVEGQEVVSTSAIVVLVVSLVIVAIGIVLKLIAGIMGVKYCKMPEKIGKCFVLAIIILAMEVISYIVSFLSGESISIISMASGLALPILYLVAVKQVQSNATEAPAEETSYTEE